MQTNDLNRLASFDTDEVLQFLKVSNFRSDQKPTKQELLETKQIINPELLTKVRSDVSKFQELGKSRRWIKRYIKRKYNITEY